MNNSKSKPQNFDEKEIKKFDAIANDWWDLNGNSKPLHQINPLRLEYIQKQLGTIKGKKILDIGCGGGILSESLAKKGAIVTGIDLADEALNIAKHHAKINNINNINYISETVEKHAQQNYQYDIITCMEMLEHVPDPKSVIHACKTLLKPNGHLFLSTINRNAKAWFLLIVGAEYITKKLPKGTHDAKKFIRPSELISWIENENMEVCNLKGLKYHLIGDYFSLSDNLDTNYIVHSFKN